jgi:hypothetical protein
MGFINNILGQARILSTSDDCCRMHTCTHASTNTDVRSLMNAAATFCPHRRQLEYHATVFTASYLTPTATLMDALNFAQSPIGPSMNVNTSINSINGKTTPKVYYNTTFASSFHTYKMVWTPTSVAWLVDKGALACCRRRDHRPPLAGTAAPRAG